MPDSSFVIKPSLGVSKALHRMLSSRGGAYGFYDHMVSGFSDCSGSRFRLLLTFSDCSMSLSTALAVICDCSGGHF